MLLEITLGTLIGGSAAAILGYGMAKMFHAISNRILGLTYEDDVQDSKLYEILHQQVCLSIVLNK